ncbi:HTH-type transcriptional regulator GltR [compost metagenome]
MTIFRAVAANLSFTKAAFSLNYVQSNVTTQIHVLEKELGVPLFDRLGGKQVVLTDAGRQLLQYAEKLLLLAEEAQATVSMRGEPTGTLRIGATETLCIYRLPSLLRAFRANYPGVQVIFRPSPVAELRRLVHSGDLDVAFVFDDAEHKEGPGDELLGYEPVWVVAAPDHPLANNRTVVPLDMSKMDLLLTEAGCCYRSHFERILNREGVYPKTMLEFNSIEAVKQCVINGLGVTVMTAASVSTEVSRGQLVRLPWSGLDLTVKTHLVWHKDKWLSPSLEAFLTLVREVFVQVGHGTA